MLVPGIDDPRKLKLGQGVRGGAAGLPALGPDIPRPSVALRRQPLLGTPATDVTPQRPVASAARLPSTEGRGVALLRRGWPNIVAGTIAKPHPGVQKAIKLLRDPDKLFDPSNRKQLNLIMHPGPNIQAAIDAHPVAKQNQVGLQQHILNKGPGVKLPAQDLIKKLHQTVGSGKMTLDQFVSKNKLDLMGMDDEAKQRFASAADVAVQSGRSKLQLEGRQYNAENFGAPIQRAYDSNIFGNAFAQAFDTITGMVPGAIQLARHPIKTGEAIGKATGKYYGPLFTGDPGKFLHNVNEQPLTPIFDLSGAGSIALGTAGRVGAVSDALAGARAASALEDLGNGAVRVGGRYGVHPMKNGRAMVRDQQTNQIIGNMPDTDTAVAHAQSLGSDMAHQSALRTAAHAFAHPELYGKTRGSYIDLLEKHSQKERNRIDAENQRIIEDISHVADDPNLKLGRRDLGEVKKQVAADMDATLKQIRTAPEDALRESPDITSPIGAHVKTSAVQSYREIMSAVRLGAIYLRPAYLPNNWAGNAFMNLTHQGFLAPVNLAKSVVLYKHMDPRNLAMMRRATGMNPAQAAIQGAPRGILMSLGHPLVEGMGKLADQPFRDAAFLHEARRAGFSSVKQVDELMNKFRAGDETAQNTVANIGRRAQEEIVKFGQLGPAEKAVANNVFFVWNWVRGSARYAARFPRAHPIQTAAYTNLAPEGQKWVDQQMGGVPWFLAGSIPVGHDKDGNPILVNPFALNPLGSTVDLARAAAGTYKAITKTGDFNKYSDSSVVDLTNPLLQEVVKAVTGQNPNVKGDLINQFVPAKLAVDLQHPGRGSMFPMSRQEALGHYIFGSLYPRHAEQTAIERALERQNEGNPQKMLDDQIASYSKATGQAPDPKFVSQVRADVEAMQDMKKFQKKYAESLGSQGFKNLPPMNKVEAAIMYLRQNAHLPKGSLDNIEASLQNVKDDDTLNQLSNTLWGMTNVGAFKQQWDEMVKDVKTPTLTPKRK